MDFTVFKSLAEHHTIVPVTDTMLADTLTPVSAYIRLRSGAKASFLLESVEGGERFGRYSFIGRDPLFTLRTADNHTTVQYHRSGDSDGRIPDGLHPSGSNFFDAVSSLIGRYTLPDLPDLPRFTGGLVGFIGYDLIRHIENIPETIHNDNNVDDAILGYYPTILAFDHFKQHITFISNVIIDRGKDPYEQYDRAVSEIQALKDSLHSEPSVTGTFTADTSTIASNISKREFEENVRVVKEYIGAGDIFQAVLSQRFGVPYRGDVFNVYRALRVVNPSPYLYFLDNGDSQVIGSSPELLIRKEGDRAETFPIAGTRHRGADDAEDMRLERELLADEKERAEHIMLVDLGRNDIGRVCKPGTVTVKDLMHIVRYSHVMHIASHVAGIIKEGIDAVEVFKAAFPAGTVTGSPKVRAMEIIDELETTRRGIYAGGVGYFDFAGNMDMCIAIRTLYAKNGTLYFQTGAGIVADSDPEKEYEETVNKSNAMREAIGVATRISGMTGNKIPETRNIRLTTP
jgi:anthranilate synthase component I